jgi:hypothetical protein
MFELWRKALIVISPNSKLDDLPKGVTVFLGGGLSIPWREEIRNYFFDLDNLVILDPTVDWDTIGQESIDNTKWVAQTDWEQTALLKSDIRAFYFTPMTDCPISLFELGHCRDRGDKTTIVCSHPDFRKRAYVSYIANRYGMAEAESVKALAELIRIQYHTRLD